MSERNVRLPKMAFQFLNDKGNRYAVIEGNRACNRECGYCDVPSLYNREQELTVRETFQQIDWLYEQGFRFLSYLGGEPLAPYKTKEDIAFAEHTTLVVDYAVNKGMIVNVTTNGDYVTEDQIRALKRVGLDSLSFSLHSYSKTGLDHLIKAARLAAVFGIIPTIHAVFTSDRTEQMPTIAAEVARNGLLFGVGIVQEKGTGFSSRLETSQIPTPGQQKEVFQALLRLKNFGFVRNNRRYLTEAPNYPDNSWKCNPETDYFLHLGAGGTIDVCSDVRTNLHVADVYSLRNDQRWREIKRARVCDCSGCLYHCYFETENPAVISNIPTVGIALLIKSGNARLAERWGQYAVERINQ